MPPELFNNTTPRSPAPPEINVEDPVAELVGEDKKFKTVADLAKGKLESDAFIARLQAEQAELREDLKARKNLEDLAEELKTLQHPKPSASNESEPKIVNETNSITPEEIERMLDQTLTKREQSSRLQSNLEIVKTRLQETLGNEFPELVLKRAALVDPTLTQEDLNNLAARNPSTFFKLMGIEPARQGSSATPMDSSINSAAFSPSAGTERNRSYYDKLKAVNKEAYYSPKVRKQMYDDALRLGEAFEDK